MLLYGFRQVGKTNFIINNAVMEMAVDKTSSVIICSSCDSAKKTSKKVLNKIKKAFDGDTGRSTIKSSGIGFIWTSDNPDVSIAVVAAEQFIKNKGYDLKGVKFYIDDCGELTQKEKSSIKEILGEELTKTSIKTFTLKENVDEARACE